MSEPWVDPLDRFRTAVKRRDVEDAWRYAGEAKRVPLSWALRLTLLLADTRDRRYVPAARRFLARFATEVEPTLLQIKKVADALDTLRLVGNNPALSEGAERALEDLARQLQRLS